MSEQMQVRALYDFEAQPNSGELTIWKDEILTVTRQDVGEGWWEGLNARGEVGLFPAVYVEQIPITAGLPPPQYPPPQPPAPAVGDDDDEWDDEFDDDLEYPQSRVGHLESTNSLTTSSTQQDSYKGPEGHQPNRTLVKKSFNRFSTFVKTGAESFILGQGQNKVDAVPSEIRILDDGETFIWEPQPYPCTCTVTSPKKASKLKGFKSYISYQITSSLGTNPVFRRYKNFAWLHERLQEKFVLVPLPPLPEKQIAGRYQDEFVQHRLIQLQMWVDRVCKHPVLSRAEVWKHFVTCTDLKNWKDGKRKHEKDKLVGAAFFHAIEAPPTPIDDTRVEKDLEHFSKWVVKMDESSKSILNLVSEQTKRLFTQRKETQKFGQLATELSTCFEMVRANGSSGLAKALKHAGETYEIMGKIQEDQIKVESEPAANVMREYKGMLAIWPEILQIQKNAMSKKKEYQKESKIDHDDLQGICNRVDTISSSVLAEKNHFTAEAVTDFKEMFRALVTAQRDMYLELAQKSEDILLQLDNQS